jgi:hypothetical protein
MVLRYCRRSKEEGKCSPLYTRMLMTALKKSLALLERKKKGSINTRNVCLRNHVLTRQDDPSSSNLSSGERGEHRDVKDESAIRRV